MRVRRSGIPDDRLWVFSVFKNKDRADSIQESALSICINWKLISCVPRCSGFGWCCWCGERDDFGHVEHHLDVAVAFVHPVAGGAVQVVAAADAEPVPADDFPVDIDCRERAADYAA